VLQRNVLRKFHLYLHVGARNRAVAGYRSAPGECCRLRLGAAEGDRWISPGVGGEEVSACGSHPRA
jgi:hypothetical protein